MIKINFDKDVFIKTGNSDDGDYVLNFDEVEFDDKKSSLNKTVTSFVRLTGKSFSHWETFNNKSSIQFLKILFSKSWLSNYIGLTEKISLFEKCFSQLFKSFLISAELTAIISSPMDKPEFHAGESGATKVTFVICACSAILKPRSLSLLN